MKVALVDIIQGRELHIFENIIKSLSAEEFSKVQEAVDDNGDVEFCLSIGGVEVNLERLDDIIQEYTDSVYENGMQRGIENTKDTITNDIICKVKKAIYDVLEVE